MGNRTYKKVTYSNPAAHDDVKSIETWYVRDAQGNVMGHYEKVDKETLVGLIPVLAEGTLALKSQPIYGASRIGQYMAKTEKHHRSLGHTHYELSNHLGNVLSVISDNKYHDPSGPITAGQAFLYKPHILSAQDYLPFGLTMQGRTYQRAGSEEYRFGFNGKEDDKEWGVQDYGLRLYSPALGKFLSVDPLGSEFPWNGTYAFAENDVIRSIDLDGGERKITITIIYDDYTSVTHTYEAHIPSPGESSKVSAALNQEFNYYKEQLKNMNVGISFAKVHRETFDPNYVRYGDVSATIRVYGDKAYLANFHYTESSIKDVEKKNTGAFWDGLRFADEQVYRAEAISLNASMGGETLKFAMITKGENRGEVGLLHETQIATAGTSGFDINATRTLKGMISLEKRLSENTVKTPKKHSWWSWIPSLSFSLYNRGEKTYELMKTKPMTIDLLGGSSVGGNIGPFGGGRAFGYNKETGEYEFGKVREFNFAPLESIRPSINFEVTQTYKLFGN